MELYETPALTQLIRLAIEEDAGRGDVTSEAIFPPEHNSTATIVAKEDGVICGLPLVPMIFRELGEKVEIMYHCEEGADITAGERVVTMRGRTVPLLVAERTILNFLQHLSGIATRARRIRRMVGDSITVVDTRKTLPGWRRLQKYAVAVGGLRNHRYDLASGVLIKDNHIAAAGSLKEAIRRVRAHAPHSLVIEVEVTTLDQLDEAVAAGADAVLLDNMDDGTMAEAVGRYRGKVVFEASGSITEDRLAALARIGIDIVSMGALTHTVTPLDLSMRIV